MPEYVSQTGNLNFYLCYAIREKNLLFLFETENDWFYIQYIECSGYTAKKRLYELVKFLAQDKKYIGGFKSKYINLPNYDREKELHWDLVENVFKYD